MGWRPRHLLGRPAVSQSVDNSLQDFAERLRRAKSPGAAWQIICQAYDDVGIEHLIYMFVRPTALSDNPLVFTNLPNWYVDYYYEERRGQDDPFLDLCTSFSPVPTGREYVEDHADILPPEQQTFIREAGETGAIAGISSPVRLANPRHFGGWNFLTSMRRAQFDKHISNYLERLQLMGFVAHEALLRTSNFPGSDGAAGELSERERECLLWLVRGLRSQEIADRLDIALVTVDLHFRRIRAKLGAATREEALAKAILSGEIVP